MDARTYYNTLGTKKTFEDPFDLSLVEKYLSKEAYILEYGCGYGRILDLLKKRGYSNLIGYDFADQMIEKGCALHPELNLNVLQESGSLSEKDETCDFIILSTILCTILSYEEQKKILDECYRVLKPKGSLYLYDFMISKHPRYQPLYQKFYEKNKEWGIYENSEGLKVRHHSTQWIFKLLEDFDVQYFAQQDHITMNGNPIRSFVSIAKKSRLGSKL